VKGAKRPRRGQGRRGPATRLLSALGALLTLLTAAAVLALIARAPPPLPPSAVEGPAPQGETPADGAAGGAGLDALAPRLLALATRPELAWLRDLAQRVRPQGFRLTDTRFTLSDTPLGESATVVLEDLRLRPEAAGWRAELQGRIDGAPTATFAGTARLTAAGERDRLRLVLSSLDLGALLERAAPERVAEATAMASAVVEAELAGGALAGDVELTLRLGEPGRIRAAAMPEALAVSELEAALRGGADGDVLTIERFALASPALRLAARGEVGPGGVDVVLAADDVDATWAPRLWPEGVAAGARDWITENITAGRIARLDLRLALDAEALAGDVLPADALYGEARIEDAEIHYLRPMPPATGADATARFDGDRMTFAITDGAAGGVAVTGGEVVVRDYADPATVERLDVDLAGRGSVPAMLALTDHEPLTLASRKGLPVAGSAGSGTFNLQVGLPLLRDLELDAVDLAFTGSFADVALPNMAAGRDLTDVDFTMEATVDSVSAAGRGRVGGVPLDLTFRVEGEREVLGARGEVEVARLAELGAPPLPVDGMVGLDATLTTTGGAERRELRVDLTAAEVEVPELSIWKPAGVAGTLEVRLVETADAVDVERFAVSWPGAEISGSARLDAAGRLQGLTVDPLRVAGTDLTIEGAREAGTLALRVDGTRLDLAPFAGGEDGAGGASPGAQAPLRLELAIAEVVAGGDGALTELSGVLGLDRDGVGEVRLDAGIRPGDGEVRARLEPMGGGDRLSLTTDDAGGLASALGLSGAMRGGALEITGTLVARRPHWRVEGEVAAQDFVLSGAPPVVRVLAAAPATAELADDDLAVARFTSPLTLDGSVLTLEDALLIASNLAVRTSGDVDLDAERLDLQGSLAPVQGVNRFIGSLPLIGALLQGSNKAGAFALSFTVRGPWRDPSVNVNPLSVVTPGVLQDLFAGAEVRPPRLPNDEAD